MSLKFYESSHRYRMTLDPEGSEDDWAPGVTTIQNAATPKNLGPWAAETAFRHIYDLWEKDALIPLLEQGLDPGIAWARKLPDQKRDRAATRGTSIHNYAEQLVAGVEVDVPEALVGPVEGTARFLDSWQIVPILTEPVGGNREHWYCGKFDLLADSVHGVGLFDYKSGKRLYGEVAYQLEAYARLEFISESIEGGEELPMPAVPDLHAAVHLTDEYPGFAVRPAERGDDVWRDFLAMRRLYDGFKRAKGTKTKPGYLHEPMAPPTAEVPA